MNKVLLIAFHFPPVLGSSGLHRTTALYNELHKYGWEPTVLTASPVAYPKSAPANMKCYSDRVIRVPTLDTVRHLSVRGKYFESWAIPDRWQSWRWLGISAAKKLCQQIRPDVIWSTYPIATAHEIAMKTSRSTGIPWVADFRDSMTEEHYPSRSRIRKRYLAIEKVAVEQAARIVFTAPGTLRMYANRYSQLNIGQKASVIANGFDEHAFRGAEEISGVIKPNSKLVLLHSGIIYPHERNPIDLFQALAELKEEDPSIADRISIRLRATGHDEFILDSISNCGIEDIVSVHPQIPYMEGIQEILQADALLLLQSASCNHQIPAKLYEYIRARKPIVALTDRKGDTAAILGNTDHALIASLNNTSEIKQAIVQLIDNISEFALRASQIEYEPYSREWQVKATARLLNDVKSN